MHPPTRYSESSDSTPPLKVSKSTWVAAPMYLIIAFSAALAGAAMAYEGLLSTDDKHGASIQSIEVQLAKHEERIFKLEQVQTKIEVMQNDLTWIRRGLEERKIIAPNPNPNGH